MPHATIAALIQAIKDLDTMEAELDDGFEVRFVADYMERIHTGQHISFSPKQEAQVIRLVGKYLGQDREDELTGHLNLNLE